MSKLTANRRIALTLTLLLSLATIGCNSSASPTAPVPEPVSSNFVTQSNAQLSAGEEPTRMWATVTSAPEMIVKGAEVTVVMEVTHQMSRKGQSSPAVYICGNLVAKRCSNLLPNDEIQAVGSSAGRRNGMRSWMITDFRYVR